jgi:phage protein U
MSIAVLGPVTFEVNADKVRTWQEASRETGARFAKHDVFEGKPKLEFIGPDLATIQLSVRLDMERGVVPRDEIRTLHAEREKGSVLQFTVGGELVGDFVLRSVREDWRWFSRDGVLTKAIVSITLEEYAT